MIQGKIAKKKSTRIVETGDGASQCHALNPGSSTTHCKECRMSVWCRWGNSRQESGGRTRSSRERMRARSREPVLFGSQCCEQESWSRMILPMDASVTRAMALQMAIRCQKMVTRRSKKKPREDLAMAMPTMANP